MKLKRGDQVIIIKGKDKGRKGKIEKVFPGKGKILVPGINLYKKHTKPQGEGKPGGIIDIVKPLRAANVALVCPKCGKPTRVGYQLDKTGGKSRICRKCSSAI